MKSSCSVLERRIPSSSPGFPDLLEDDEDDEDIQAGLSTEGDGYEDEIESDSDSRPLKKG